MANYGIMMTLTSLLFPTVAAKVLTNKDCRTRNALLLVLLATLLATRARAAPAPMTDVTLLNEVQRRAFRFFWEKADGRTGLVQDRARNSGTDRYTVASIASTGYGLAALPIAVERGWIKRGQATERARRTLTFLLGMPHKRGWLYHFVDKRNGRREWNSEISTIDTSLLVAGALVCGQYFAGTEVQRLAERLYNRLDWQWMLTNGGAQPDKLFVSHGWRPERGFIPNNWAKHDEASLLYLLGMGASKAPLPPKSWAAWGRPLFRYGQWETLTGGPIFLHQMPHGYYDFRNRRDSLGYDYWVSSVHATRIHRQFCIDRMGQRKTYGPNIWGINASDGPNGYVAYGIPEPEDGTISPTGALASIPFVPELSLAAGRTIYARHGGKIWGRYGFANAFNVDANWYDPDVIGIDLGMALLAIENHRTGLIWRLMGKHPSTARAFAAAGLRITQEKEPRVLRRSGS